MNIFNIKNYSFTVKTLCVFFIILLILISIRTLLIQPKIKEKNLNSKINFITSKLLLVKDIYTNDLTNNKKDLEKILLKNSEFKSLKIELLFLSLENQNFLFEERNNKLIWRIELKNKNEFLKYTIDRKEIENSIDTGLFFLLPETLTAILISFLILSLIFKKMLYNIDFLTKKLTDSLEEKEILLKEIHHRVKNNLSLIISLIELQEEEIDDINVRKALKEIQERVYSMELLHRKLYETTNFRKIDFKNYVIDLANTIKNSYDLKSKVDLNIKINDISLNIENAVPFGLILNELLTNSFKYAYKDIDKPKLFIDVKQKEEEIFLAIKDNGCGLKNDFYKLSNETLGLKLVNMIVKFQLNGNIDYVFEDGAKFIINGKFSR